MDLSLFVSADTADCVIADPRTGQSTEIKISVYGMDSAKFRGVMKSAAAVALKAKAAGQEPPEGAEVDAQRLAELTAGWSGLEDGGKPIKFSEQAALDVYTRSPEIRRQVDRFIFKVGNFLPKA